MDHTLDPSDSNTTTILSDTGLRNCLQVLTSPRTQATPRACFVAWKPCKPSLSKNYLLLLPRFALWENKRRRGWLPQKQSRVWLCLTSITRANIPVPSSLRSRLNGFYSFLDTIQRCPRFPSTSPRRSSSPEAGASCPRAYGRGQHVRRQTSARLFPAVWQWHHALLLDNLHIIRLISRLSNQPTLPLINLALPLQFHKVHPALSNRLALGIFLSRVTERESLILTQRVTPHRSLTSRDLGHPDFNYMNLKT